MAEVLSHVSGEADSKDNKEEYIYFHSGSTPTYRKVLRPSLSKSFTTIPTIDISLISSPSLSIRKAIAKETYSACTTCGFFYIKNHGIPEDLIQETFEVIKRFFDEDIDVKMEAHSLLNPAIRGYEPMFFTKLDPTTTGDFKEAFTMGDCVLEPEQSYISKTGALPPPHITKPQNIWPTKAPYFREGVYRYYNAILPLAMKLVQILALAFDLDEHAFVDEFFKFPITGMRPLHYPAMTPENEENRMGLGAHADFSWLTLVLQDAVPALEVLNPDGLWVSGSLPTPSQTQ